MGPHFPLMDNNAYLHRVELVDEYLDSKNLECMQWPVYSPDYLDPIENLWDALERTVSAHQYLSPALPETKAALLQEWQLLSSCALDRQIEVMKRRC